MGLDAYVYCNCFETGNLKEAPPYPDLISVTADGSLEFRSVDLEILLALDEWHDHRACAHQSGILLHHRIGNMATVGLLRKELGRESEKFPVILKQILYNGMHGGDYLSLDDVNLLRSELVSLSAFVSSDATTAAYVESFRLKLCEPLIAICVALTFGASISARGWCRIVPLHSTRADLESLLGKPLPDRYEREKDGCPEVWTDNPSVITSIRINGKTKEYPPFDYNWAMTA